MQTAAKEALDISRESPATRRMYGLDDPETREFGTRCLIARRLVERGVRFVQVCTGNQNWDHHGGIVKSLPRMCRKVDRPSAALVQDLKQRGLLDSTVVAWGGEMGRLPVIQNEKNVGRDHNTYGFSMWLAGGGFKAGHVHGATDEFGHKAVEDVVTHSRLPRHPPAPVRARPPARSPSAARTASGSLVDGQPARVVRGVTRLTGCAGPESRPSRARARLGPARGPVRRPAACGDDAAGSGSSPAPATGGGPACG